MTFIINALLALGSGIFWIVQKFFPFLLKKFGLVSVKFGIQSTISALVFVVTLAFWAAFVVFITETYSQFKVFIALISNPTLNNLGGQGQDYIACFMYLLEASGISNGLNSAFSFTIMLLLFMFSLVLYKTAISTLKLVSDELSKLISASNLGL